MTRQWKLVVQEQPNLDAIVSLYLFFVVGGDAYSNAEVEFWRYGTCHPSGKTWRDYEKEGKILIGVGGSPLDEHPSPDFGDRKAQGESATSLTAKMLGVHNNPLYRPLIQLVTKSDLEGAGQDRDLHLATIVKQMHRMMPDNPHGVIKWTFQALDAIVAKQRRFIEASKQIKDLVHAQACEVEIDGQTYGILGIDSDNDQTGPAARMHGYAVVIQYRKNGNVCIFGNQKMGVRMHKVAIVVRAEELVRRNLKKEARDYYHLLDEPGQMTIVPNWCYQMPGENMLNGTETASGLEPTKIDAITLLEIVKNNMVIEKKEQAAA